VRISELPSADCTVFRDTSFFRSYDHDLPSADQVRAKGLELWGPESLLPTPKPVLFEEFDLVVKYGADVLIAEGQCLWYFNRHMRDHVPTPEVYGWQVEGGQTFLYMQFVHGETLADVWPSMREEDRDAICEELHQCVAAWRELRQESKPYYIGTVTTTFTLQRTKFGLQLPNRPYRPPGRRRHHLQRPRRRESGPIP